jgi:hypothetical protein
MIYPGLKNHNVQRINPAPHDKHADDAKLALQADKEA